MQRYMAGKKTDAEGGGGGEQDAAEVTARGGFVRI